jgi:hypothetical protein
MNAKEAKERNTVNRCRHRGLGMTTFITTCRTCGREFAPGREAIRAGSWRLCPGCQPPLHEETRCEGCGRVLRTAGRQRCLSCLGGSAL